MLFCMRVTVLAVVCGMHFEAILELQWKWVFSGVDIICVLVAFGFSAVFRREG